MKILVMLNENAERAHSDVYRAFDYFKNNKIIYDYRVYPFLARLNRGLSEKAVNTEICEHVDDFLPDAILWMHTTNLAISSLTFRKIYLLSPHTVMGYWDGDLYDQHYKPVPRQMRKLASRCDVTFLQGFGETSDVLKKHGCHNIRYVPAFADPMRFKKVRNTHKLYDVVFVGNNIESKNPFRRSMGGTVLRQEIVKEFSDHFNEKFAVFGLGWKGASARGKVDYLKQAELYSQSRITIGVNHINGKYYFSDRLPIAMISGIPIIYSYEQGFEEIFAECDNLLFFKTKQEALELATSLLTEQQQKLDLMGDQLHSFALKHLTNLNAFGFMIDVLKYHFIHKQGKEAGNYVVNPWVGHQNLNMF